MVGTCVGQSSKHDLRIILRFLTNSLLWQYLISEETLDIATNFAKQNPALVAGRLSAGAGLGIASGNLLASPTVGGVAAFGDAMNAIDNGASSLERFIPAMVGGQ